ncbi:MAG: hypothetical protein IJI06_05615, partial [Oscillospiraceae bacterium]|nr:hypothetical protein [Oscillospiraceae bacterium]
TFVLLIFSSIVIVDTPLLRFFRRYSLAAPPRFFDYTYSPAAVSRIAAGGAGKSTLPASMQAGCFSSGGALSSCPSGSLM